jgi:hypothetical protein
MSDQTTEEIDPFDLDPKQRSEFFAAIGEAVSAWQHVELMLYRVYECLIEPGKIAACNAAFYAVRDFRLKLDITNAAAEQSLMRSPLLEKWRKLSKKAGNRSIKRNHIVHFIVLSTNDTLRIEDRIYLSPNVFNFTHMFSDNKNKTMNLKQVREAAQSFRLTAGNLYRFAIELRTFPKPQ